MRRPLRPASAQAPARPRLPAPPATKLPTQIVGAPARSPGLRMRRAVVVRKACWPDEARASRVGLRFAQKPVALTPPPRRRVQGFERAHRAVDGAARRSTVSAPPAIARRRAASARARSGFAQVLRARDLERSAGVVERRIGVREIRDHRPVQNGRRESPRARSDSGRRRRRKTCRRHEPGPGGRISQFAFVSRHSPPSGPIASPCERRAPTRPCPLSSAQNRLAPIGMARRYQR